MFAEQTKSILVVWIKLYKRSHVNYKIFKSFCSNMNHTQYFNKN